MAGHNVIVVGASAGGVEAFQRLVAGLPADLPAAVLVVLHMSADSPGVLDMILSRAGPLPCVQAENGMPLEAGRIYVPRPDHHLLVKDGLVRVVQGPRENGSRPAIDPLFRSAAAAYGPAVVGVVLTGLLDDGTAGLYAVKQGGGVAIVQDPREALFPDMPRNAMQKVQVDYCLPLADIPPTLARLAHEPVKKAAPVVPPEVVIETEIAEGQVDKVGKISTPSVFSCPECGGVLGEIREGSLLRFRCQVGHAYTAKTLAAEQVERLEGALWSALRIIEERIRLDLRIADDARQRAVERLADRFEARALELEEQAKVIRDILFNHNGLKPPDEGE
jgi:two-component system chemotaxis response regulator CheB